MKLKTISVTVGLTVPHPTKNYANFKPEVTIVADLGPKDNINGAIRRLQLIAEREVSQHVAKWINEHKPAPPKEVW